MGRPKRKEQSGSPVKDSDSSKRRRQTSTPVSLEFSDGQSIAEFGRTALKQINEAKDSRRGQLLASDFQTVPSKDELPRYHQIIKNPVALDTIESKLDSYASVDDMLDDFKLMEANAHTFNKSNSLIAQYSTRIRTMVDEFIAARNEKLEASAGQNADDQSQARYDETRDALLGVLDYALNNLKDSGGDHFAGDLFRTMVSKKKYPDYYRLIKNPTSISVIEKKLKSKEWPLDSMVDQFEEELWLMLNNAAEYNEPESEVVQDAKILENFFKKRLPEVRKTLQLSPRALPPTGSGAQKAIKSEDVVMTNGIESTPRLLIKMNGQKKAESPASIPDSSRHSTAVSTPAATSAAQSPPPITEQQGALRAPLKQSYSPNLSAASPGNLRTTLSVSPLIPNASMVPQNASQQPIPSAAATTQPAKASKQKKYPEFSLGGPVGKDGMLSQPSLVSNHSIERRPGTSVQDSPIQLLRISTRSATRADSRWSQILKPEKRTYKSNSIHHLSAEQACIRIEPYLHPTITATRKGYGIWVKHGNSYVPPQPSQSSGKGPLHYWDLNLTPGRENVIEVICDMLRNDRPGKEAIEKAVFLVNIVIFPT
ncbi:hypothetical protein DRE_06682 [Drechslerella stenobrocha 248]|uniref:Bromo domain-containing protein n=1 Tax=Drechslerella stenobrocha 248 TaxID=1043628 RepID=W7HKT2_9PEZI|nr:hypothetical protein DRE_06682 [Drechslerella stenobrocha 248]